MKRLFISLLLVAGLMACKSSKSANDVQIADRVDYDNFAPEAIEAVLNFQEVKTENEITSIRVTIDEILREGRNAPTVKKGQEVWIPVSSNLMSKDDLSDLKTGDKLNALMEYETKQGGMGQSSPAGVWKLLSIKK